MIPESLTATGVVSAAQPVVSAFGGVLALALTLSFGVFAVMFIIAQVRGITRDLEVRGYGKGGGYWQKPRR